MGAIILCTAVWFDFLSTVRVQKLTPLFVSESAEGTLVLGEAGSGKSTLLCDWISHLQSKYKSEVLPIYHFVGYGENSTSKL